MLLQPAASPPPAPAPSFATDWLPVVYLMGPIILLIILYAAAVVLFYRYGTGNKQVQRLMQSTSPGALLSMINSGGVYLIVLAVSAQFASSPRFASPRYEFGCAVGAATAGLALGWVIGIIISPGSKDEEAEFSLLTKAVSTLLTGYVLGYLKDVKTEQIVAFLKWPGIPFRIMVGAACCFSTIAVVFISRRAELMKATAREWFVSFTPTDPRHRQALRADVLARGPFSSKQDAEDEIDIIKAQDDFKGVTLTPVRVEIFSEHTGTPQPVTSTTSARPNTNSDGTDTGTTGTSEDTSGTAVKTVTAGTSG